uniref:(northern house mosquito) hypothetical protein n=1 Tax=Culex pipiens TaxID=7175 RepID=A0A8D8BAF8_CULPI
MSVPFSSHSINLFPFFVSDNTPCPIPTLRTPTRESASRRHPPGTSRTERTSTDLRQGRIARRWTLAAAAAPVVAAVAAVTGTAAEPAIDAAKAEVVATAETAEGVGMSGGIEAGHDHQRNDHRMTGGIIAQSPVAKLAAT